MKTVLCNQLGGPDNCTHEFSGTTFEEVGEQSKKHAMEMAANGDQPHIDKMEEMKTLMASDPQAAQKWYQDKKAEFENSTGA